MNQADYIIELQGKIIELENQNLLLRRQQIEITQAKELYLKIFEDFPALIWRSGLDKLCNYFNKTWLDFTGRTMEQEYGNGWAEGVHPDDFAFCLDTYVNAFEKKEAFLMEYRMKNKFGEYCWIRDFGRPFYDLDNTFLGYIGSCYDITNNKNNELKLIELNRVKDRFFAIIAHDLKNPFNTLIGFSNQIHVAIQNKEFEKVEKYSHIIQESTELTYSLLINLLDWSRSQTGLIDFKPEVFKLNLLVELCIKLIQPGLIQKNISLIQSLQPDVFIYADRNMMNTIIRNLLSNAVKYTNLGGEIHISSYCLENQIELSVSDNGIGIKPDDLSKLFHLDYHFSKDGTNNEKGTGLGLLLCKEFVDKHQGTINISSKYGIGTEINIVLPRNKPLD